jgi:pseudouridine-5'-phosphate glycosidase
MQIIQYSQEVAQAVQNQQAVVGLETAVVTHGLPYPTNLSLARDMEEVIREEGAVPATVGVLEGAVRVGFGEEQLNALAEDDRVIKISRRDFSAAVAQQRSGGTTVAGTLTALARTEIRVFATGGIGGVHRDAPFDVSADLPTLAQSPLVVVCAGAKAILDLPATLEYLETVSVPVVGYRTDEFPAFYARSSGLPVSVRAETPRDVVEIARAHWGMGLQSAVLVVVPPPEETALAQAEMEAAISTALEEAQEQEIHGQQVTPFLLDRVSVLTGQASLRANLSLLLQNARVAARIARLLRG